MELGPHAGFIVTAYGATIGIVSFLIMWVALDRRRLRRELDELEARGLTRRSEHHAEGP